jgi:hypothetical protein
MIRRTTTAIVGTCLAIGLLVAGDPIQAGFAGHPGIESTLAQAREDLRLSRLTLAHIQRDLAALRDRPDVDQAVLDDYSIYLAKVRAMTDAHQRIVREMETLSGVLEPIFLDTDWQPVDAQFFDPPVPEAVDALALLDRELEAELAAFDAFLLKEQYEAARRMEQIDEASSEEMTTLAREAAAAVERLRNKGIDVDTNAPPEGTQSEGEGDGAAGGQPGGAEGAQDEAPEGSNGDPAHGEPGGAAPAGGTEGKPGTGDPADAGAGQEGAPGNTGGDGTTGGGSSTGGSGGSSTSPPSGTPGSEGDGSDVPPRQGDRPPADDDDIVARQLREAAEKETDPVLKEKLWQEYDKYKGSS